MKSTTEPRPHIRPSSAHRLQRAYGDAVTSIGRLHAEVAEAVEYQEQQASLYRLSLVKAEASVEYLEDRVRQLEAELAELKTHRAQEPTEVLPAVKVRVAEVPQDWLSDLQRSEVTREVAKAHTAAPGLLQRLVIAVGGGE